MQTNKLQNFFAESTAMGCSPARIAIENQDMAWKRADLWYRIDADAADDSYDVFDDFVHKDTVIGQYAVSVANAIKFPKNTAFVHALGCVASAMNLSFWYEYYGSEKPVNLYVVTSQPPATGKSGVNGYLTDPIYAAYKEAAKKNAIERPVLINRIKKLEAELEKETKDAAILQMSADLVDAKEKLDDLPEWVYSLEDVTPEALEAIAMSQKGVFNIISDEATAINSAFGMMYSDKPANNGVILKGWDWETISTGRVGRGFKSGRVRGCFAVIAQDETFRSVLECGMRGNGVAERFLLLREGHILGSRDHNEVTRIDQNLKAQYEQLCRNLVLSGKVVFKLSPEATTWIRAYKNDFESGLGDGGEYSHSLMRGVVGKADKQIIKIACILHAAKEWADGGSRSTFITDDDVISACAIFRYLIKAYQGAAQSQGYSGEEAEKRSIIETITTRAEKKGDSIGIGQLRDIIKNKTVFRGTSRLTTKLREKLLPQLERENYIVFHNDMIYFNPMLGR